MMNESQWNTKLKEKYKAEDKANKESFEFWERIAYFSFGFSVGSVIMTVVCSILFK